MKKTETRKRDLVEKMADHLLLHGLKGASLRPLAASAGTSDRMLLHYFADKDELMSATLTRLAERLLAILDHVRPEPVPLGTLLPRLAGMLHDPQVRPYLRLWLELAAASAGGDEPCRAVARRIGDIFLAWISAALAVEREEDRAPTAALAFATTEGLVVLDAVDSGALIPLALQAFSLR